MLFWADASAASERVILLVDSGVSIGALLGEMLGESTRFGWAKRRREEGDHPWEREDN
jgi:broad specificity phosphatase PhoE